MTNRFEMEFYANLRRIAQSTEKIHALQADIRQLTKSAERTAAALERITALMDPNPAPPRLTGTQIREALTQEEKQ